MKKITGYLCLLVLFCIPELSSKEDDDTKKIRNEVIKVLKTCKSSFEKYSKSIVSVKDGTRKANTEGERNKILTNKSAGTIPEEKNVVAMVAFDAFLSQLDTFFFYMIMAIDYIIKGLDKISSSTEKTHDEGSTFLRVGIDWLNQGITFFGHFVLISTELMKRICVKITGNSINNASKLFELEKIISSGQDLSDKAKTLQNITDSLSTLVSDSETSLPEDITKKFKLLENVSRLIEKVMSGTSAWCKESNVSSNEDVFSDVDTELKKLDKALNANIKGEHSKSSADTDSSLPQIKKKKKDRGKKTNKETKKEPNDDEYEDDDDTDDENELSEDD
jgi:hypothetical protein